MSKPTFYIKQHDTRPRLAVRVSSEPTDVFASVRFNMTTNEGVAVVTGGTGLIELQPSPTAQGVVSYQWQSADTATDGVYLAEFEITFNDGSKETYPNYDFIEVRILEDLA